MSEPRPRFDLATTPIESGITFLEASAGTGKTYCLSGLMLRLVLEGHVSGIEKILLMTFTRAATAELVGRIRTALREAIAVFEGKAEKDPGLFTALYRRHGQPGRRILTTALRRLDDVEISTIHGFCRRILEQNALECATPFDVEYIENDLGFLRRAAEDFWRKRVYPAGRRAAACIAERKYSPTSFVQDFMLWRRHADTRIQPAALSLSDALAALDAADTEGLETAQGDFVHALRVAFIGEVAELLAAEKSASGVAGHDDVLLRLHHALADPRSAAKLRLAIGGQFEALLVDEFQDTDAIQFGIFSKLLPDARTFYVGDPKQAIYGFRGADVFAYMQSRDKADRVYTLRENWRSERSLVAATAAIFSRSQRPFVVDGIDFVDVQAGGRADETPLHGDARKSLEWVWLGNIGAKTKGVAQACEAVTTEILHLLDPVQGPRIGTEAILPRQIAVLTRTHEQAQSMRQSLASVGVPAVVSKSGNVFKSDEASDLLRLLTAVLDPRDAAAVRAALATRVWGRDAADLAALTADGDKWQEVVLALEEIRSTWRTRGFAAMTESLLEHCRARERLLGDTAGPRRLTNLLHLVELLQQASVAEHMSPEALLASLAAANRDDDKEEDDEREEAQLRLESDADAVQIATVHGSKGLEYDIVFCPFLWDRRGDEKETDSTLIHTAGGVVLHLPKLPQEVIEARWIESLSEAARFAYVALTRAKHRCYIVWGLIGRDSAAKSALAYLLYGHDSAAAGQAPAKNTKGAKTAKTAKSDLADRWRAQLASLCAANSAVMGLRDHEPPDTTPHRTAGAAKASPLTVRTLSGTAARRLLPLRVASFSTFRMPTGAAAREAAELPDHVDPALSHASDEALAQGIFAFARGARAGSCLHEILENCDFATTGSPATEALVRRTLERHGLLDDSAHEGPIQPQREVLAMLGHVTSSRLPGSDFALCSVDATRRLNEWQFYLPMGAVSQGDIAETLAKHGSSAIRDDYPRRLRALGARKIEGFLTGFVDLVFTDGKRWYVVDWKSNHLGNDTRAYAHNALAEAMDEHHYVLQYHLYVLALHRHLASRLRGYEYERDFGGVYYAFLRGIRAEAGTGWYHDRPPWPLVEALDTLIGGRKAA